MAGQLFDFHGKTYMPSQNCERGYGGGVIIKEVFSQGDDYTFTEVKRLVSPHPTRRARLHTLNEYKGMVIIDVGGFDFPIIAKWMQGISRLKKAIK